MILRQQEKHLSTGKEKMTNSNFGKITGMSTYYIGNILQISYMHFQDLFSLVSLKVLIFVIDPYNSLDSKVQDFIYFLVICHKTFFSLYIFLKVSPKVLKYRFIEYIAFYHLFHAAEHTQKTISITF